MNEKAAPSGNLLMLAGIIILAFGIVAIAAPMVAGSLVSMIVGAVMLVAGIAQIYSGTLESEWNKKLPLLIIGGLITLAGITFLTNPIKGQTILTFFLAIIFMVEGAWRILTSFSYRPATGWVVMLISGVFAILLGVLLISQWPLSGLWAIGVLLGINLMMTGLSLIALASTINPADQPQVIETTTAE